MGIGKNGLASAKASDTVVYKLSDSSGKTLKLFNVPADKVAEFQSVMEQERQQIEQQINSSVTLVKVEKIFG